MAARQKSRSDRSFNLLSLGKIYPRISHLTVTFEFHITAKLKAMYTLQVVPICIKLPDMLCIAIFRCNFLIKTQVIAIIISR